MIRRDIPINKRTVDTDDAVALFRQYGMEDKERLFAYRRVSKVNLYSINEFEDYFYGYMASHTGYLRYFDLKSYDEGFVLEFPERNRPDEIPPFALRKNLSGSERISGMGGKLDN